MALSSKKNNIFKKVKDYVQKQDGLYPVSRDTSSDTVFMGNSNASDVNTLTTVIGDGNYTSGDNGEMAEGLYSDSLIPKITDNESFTSAMPKLTRIVNNVRYLVHALGTSDITQIGDGTLTGAISTLNSNLTFEYTYVPANRQELGTTYTLSLIKVGRIVTANATFIPSTDISYSSDQAPLFILPEGYRPYLTHSANAPNVSGLSPLVLVIKKNGDILMQNISGPIKSGMYTTFQACWICA